MAMTLNKAVDHVHVVITSSHLPGWKENREAWDVIRSHITQPAQAVDVGAIREVIETMREASAGRALFQNGRETGCYEAWIDKLTAALPTSPTDKEG